MDGTEMSDEIRPYTSLIALNSSFDLPTEDLSSKSTNNDESVSMIVNVDKKSKGSSKTDNIQQRDGNKKVEVKVEDVARDQANFDEDCEECLIKDCGSIFDSVPLVHESKFSIE